MKNNLQNLDFDLREIKGVTSQLVDCKAHLAKTLNFYQELQVYISYINSLYTPVETYRAAFYAFKVELFFNLLSLASAYITLQFLLPIQLASIPIEFAFDEILCGTIIFPAVHLGHEAICFEFHFVLEVTLLSAGLSVVLGIPMKT